MLKKHLLAALAIAAAVAGSRVSLAADDKPADKPAAEAKPAVDASGVKLTKPWSDLKLTDEQKVKINAIHKKSLAEINALEKKELDEITALLTDAQRWELKELADKKKKDAAAKRAADKAAADKPADKK
jgi:Spy/CpxP family protein refolding chaperone